MQLAKNNNAMWRVISDGDQPLPPQCPPPSLLQHPDRPLPPIQHVPRKSMQGQKNVAGSTEKVNFLKKCCLTFSGLDQ